MESWSTALIISFLFVCLLFIQTFMQDPDDDDLQISNRLLFRLTLAVFLSTVVAHEFVLKSSSFKTMGKTGGLKVDRVW